MSEKTAWTTVRGHLQALPGRKHIQRFEDKLTGGIPDTNFCWNGHECWMEGKFVKDLPKRATTKVKIGLRPDQALWLETRQRAGTHVFVWVRVRDYGWLLFERRFRALQDGLELSDFLNEPVFSSAKDIVKSIAHTMEFTCRSIPIEPTDEDYDDMHHALGRPRNIKSGYRNYYCCERGGATARRFESLGWWYFSRAINDNNDAVYCVSEKGKEALAAWMKSRA